MRASAFVKKYSVQFVSPSGKASQPFYFFNRYAEEVGADLAGAALGVRPDADGQRPRQRRDVLEETDGPDFCTTATHGGRAGAKPGPARPASFARR